MSKEGNNTFRVEKDRSVGDFQRSRTGAAGRQPFTGKQLELPWRRYSIYFLCNGKIPAWTDFAEKYPDQRRNND